MKNLKTAFNICTLFFLMVLSTSVYSQNNTFSKVQKSRLSEQLSNDEDFNFIVMSTSFLSMSIGSVDDIKGVQMLNDYKKLIKFPIEKLKKTHTSLNQLTSVEVEEIVNLSIEKLNEKTAKSDMQKVNVNYCLNQCSNQWKSCAKLGWKEYIFIGCVVGGTAAIIAADIITDGTTLPATYTELLWLRNGCASALGISTGAASGACWEEFRSCAAACRK